VSLHACIQINWLQDLYIYFYDLLIAEATIPKHLSSNHEVDYRFTTQLMYIYDYIHLANQDLSSLAIGIVDGSICC